MSKQKDLKDIDIQIPSPYKSNKKIPSSSIISQIKSSSKIKQQNILHHDSYYYLNKSDSVIHLITDDFRLVCLPQNILPLYVKPGTKLSITIEQVEDKQLKQQQQQIIKMQQQFLKKN